MGDGGHPRALRIRLAPRRLGAPGAGARERGNARPPASGRGNPKLHERAGELHPGRPPLEAGLGFAVAFDKKSSFIGRDALLREREKGLDRRMLAFALEDPEPLLLHDEPIWRDGRLVDRSTSGAYAHSVGRALALGYVEWGPDDRAADLNASRWEIEIARRRYPARASLRPFYDPKSERLHG
jgi:glycine cleavage system aminomethyltransferase T